MGKRPIVETECLQHYTQFVAQDLLQDLLLRLWACRKKMVVTERQTMGLKLGVVLRVGIKQRHLPITLLFLDDICQPFFPNH